MAASSFETVVLVGNTGDRRVADTMNSLVPHLRRRGLVTWLLRGPGPGIEGCETVEPGTLDGRADLVIAVGGDGTMLYATNQAAAHGIPLLGINRGRLGFLADIGPDEMNDRLDEVLDGEYVSESRAMLSATMQQADSAGCLALNDVVIQREGNARMIEVETYIDGVYVNAHVGDGLIIATPTGSTAYALSGGGPILEPSLEALVLVPICPHTLSDRPVVIDAQSKIEVRMTGRPRARAVVNCDGRPIGALGVGAALTVELAQCRATLLHPRGHDYFRILRSKLSWGRGSQR